MRTVIKYSLIVISITAVVMPVGLYLGSSNFFHSLASDISTSSKFNLFMRLFGIIAFALLWLQIMLGTFRIPLTKIFGPKVLKFHMTSGLFTFLLATLHPLFFYIAQALIGQYPPFNALTSYLGENYVIYGYMGAIAYTLLIASACTAYFRTKPFFVKNWRLIHYMNYIIFVLVFLHSYTIGSNIRGNSLMELLYMFYAVTFAAGVVYKWGYIRIYPKIRNKSNIPVSN